jgi:SNF2 family DNA or RNA helicase
MTFTGKLRPYQESASNLICERKRALLALDLGTGKTIVSIHAIEKLRDEGKVKCAVLIMSASLTKQWEQRIQQFTTAAVVTLVDGSIPLKKRSSILKDAMETRPEYLIIGIRQAVSSLGFINSLNPELILVDEVTSIKNFGTQQTKAVKKMKSTYRIGLTAEPIENGKAEELFSIMQWIDPTVLGNWQEFEDNYIIRSSAGFTVGYKNMPELNTRLMEACISKRRTDKDVAEFMPTVEEFNCYIEMDEETRVYYNEIVRDLFRALITAGPAAAQELSGYYAGTQRSDGGSGLGQIGARLVAASLLLDSPVLLRASGDAYNDPGIDGGSSYASDLIERLRDLPEGFYGAKYEACTDLAQQYLEEDPRHKVIIFARFRGMIPLLVNGLSKYNSVEFHGGLNGSERGIAIERFNNEPDTRLFISSDAGGYGVDLWSASHLVNYDLPNSSGALKQRNGRHVRASSTFRKVFIDNLIVAGSVEEYQLTRLNYKSRVSNAVLTGLSEADGRVTDEGTSLTKFLKNYLESK